MSYEQHPQGDIGEDQAAVLVALARTLREGVDTTVAQIQARIRRHKTADGRPISAAAMTQNQIQMHLSYLRVGGWVIVTALGAESLGGADNWFLTPKAKEVLFLESNGRRELSELSDEEKVKWGPPPQSESDALDDAHEQLANLRVDLETAQSECDRLMEENARAKRDFLNAMHAADNLADVMRRTAGFSDKPCQEMREALREYFVARGRPVGARDA